MSFVTNIFNLYFSGMVAELNGARMGVKMDDEYMWCGALLYADDIVLLADTGVVQNYLDVVEDYVVK